MSSEQPTPRYEGVLRSDRRVHPTRHTFEVVPYADLRARKHSHVWTKDDAGRFAQVKVTSVDTWKTRPEIVVRVKYGLYEHYSETVRPGDSDTGFYLQVFEEVTQ